MANFEKILLEIGQLIISLFLRYLLPINKSKFFFLKKSIFLFNSEDNYVEMSLVKNLGFSINYGYKVRSNYKDEKLFDELKPVLVQRLKEINADNFNEIWTDLMKESGVLRDSNLDDILNG